MTRKTIKVENDEKYKAAFEDAIKKDAINDNPTEADLDIAINIDARRRLNQMRLLWIIHQD
jgi:hypothetical protein